ncbi:MAG: enoyl-CoA hydratase/isomerase family protein [Burkholderiales bacterium]|nr:MAG: enoyl-CoA hydratase/isomerase family protein [Burkholderiales bacterium]
MSGLIRSHVDEGVLRVVISHPSRFNAMDRAMWRCLRETFTAVQGHGELLAVVIEGEGAHFCAGGDISEYPQFRFDEAALRSFHEEDVWRALQAVIDCDLPVVAAIAGNCMGAGVEIASCCDIRLASEGARFGAPIARLGFPMAPREAQLVARAVGELTAREMLLSAAVLTAAEMKSRGFLNRVVPEDDLAPELGRMLEGMRSLSPMAARLNKQTLRSLAAGQPASALVATAYGYAGAREHREGIMAFLEKRPAVFV